MSITKTTDWRAVAGRAETFWSCDDGAETLSCTELEEAVEEYVDGFLSPGCDTEAILREKVSPLTIYGYTRVEVRDRDLDNLAEWLSERLAELVEEDEWGDPNGNYRVINDEGAAAFTARFAAVLREERARIVPWTCEVTTEVEIEGDELVAMVRDCCPYWFEKEVGS
jgi:hypothetical protein